MFKISSEVISLIVFENIFSKLSIALFESVFDDLSLKNSVLSWQPSSVVTILNSFSQL